MTVWSRLKLRWKLVVFALPLVIVPIAVVGVTVGAISVGQAHRGVARTSADDLEHMAEFTVDLLEAHYRQFEVYRKDKERTVRKDLATLLDFAYNLVEAQARQADAGRLDPDTARREARRALKDVSIGETGYLYAITSKGVLTVHPAQEGADIYDSRDDDGRYFIRELCRAAVKAPPGQVDYIVYPWRNEILGDTRPRRKVVAFRYFAPWDWILAAGSYLDETYEDAAFERRSFEALKARIKAKKVGRTGYIYALTSDGTLTIHPAREGDNIYDSRDDQGRYFIREICRTKRGWIRYPWRNPGEPAARMKIVRYEYFRPWDWIVGVGSYEDEFYGEAHRIRERIAWSVVALTLAAVGLSTGLVVLFSKVFTDPIREMGEVIGRVRRGRLDERVPVRSEDELGELAEAFNEMIEVLRRNHELEETLSQQGKMASLGVLASGVAHEINNPLGVIMGYAGHLERKLDPETPGFRYAAEIKRESHRCRKIVQNLLSYARIPQPEPEPTDLNALVEQIAAFAATHTELQGVRVQVLPDPSLPLVRVDPDQIRQVALNLLLNAGAAMDGRGTCTVRTRAVGDGAVEVAFEDTGRGIAAEDLDKVFEPFFTTKRQGTGLGLAITRQLVKQHGGTIRVESTPGQGTAVTVRLPAGAGES
ncbi:MAG: cache domain-containing protein [Deferrisomatales bacterium]